jgi:hypothetical protein
LGLGVDTTSGVDMAFINNPMIESYDRQGKIDFMYGGAQELFKKKKEIRETGIPWASYSKNPENKDYPGSYVLLPSNVQTELEEKFKQDQIELQKIRQSIFQYYLLDIVRDFEEMRVSPAPIQWYARHVYEKYKKTDVGEKLYDIQHAQYVVPTYNMLSPEDANEFCYFPVNTALPITSEKIKDMLFKKLVEFYTMTDFIFNRNNNKRKFMDNSMDHETIFRKQHIIDILKQVIREDVVFTQGTQNPFLAGQCHVFKTDDANMKHEDAIHFSTEIKFNNHDYIVS